MKVQAYIALHLLELLDLREPAVDGSLGRLFGRPARWCQRPHARDKNKNKVRAGMGGTG
jgi:hypothetical protein